MERIGVCDDDIEVAGRIAAIVSEAFKKLGYDCETESFSEGSALLEKDRADPFDVLFLDIDMPGVGGFDIARSLRERFSHCRIVFVTSHSELVFDSLDFQPFNFIRKNSDLPLEESIPKVVGKLAYHFIQDKTVRIDDRNLGAVFVRISDIISLESSGHYIIYRVFRGGEAVKIVSRGVISEREEFFEDYGFARAHKGFLINLSRVEHLSTKKHEVELSCGINVPIGKKYRSELEEKYSLFLRRRI